MKKKQAGFLAILVLVAAFTVGFVVSDAQGQGCWQEEYFVTWCNHICTKDGGVWGCWEMYAERCCWVHVEGGACGEGTIDQCPECSPGGCGF